jgi:ribonuclease HI
MSLTPINQAYMCPLSLSLLNHLKGDKADPHIADMSTAQLVVVAEDLDGTTPWQLLGVQVVSRILSNSDAVSCIIPKGSSWIEALSIVKATATNCKKLSTVEWDVKKPSVVFTDGSCPKNGKVDAVAAFAVKITAGPMQGIEISGRVATQLYALVDTENPESGFHPVGPRNDIQATNNRGEYLACCWALLVMLRGKTKSPIEIVTDCNLFIQTMNSWLPRRREKGSAAELKNYDLICIAEVILKELRSRTDVKLTHVRSHQICPKNDEIARSRWQGNFDADFIAGEAIHSLNEFKFIQPLLFPLSP